MPLPWRCLALFPISRLLGIPRDNESLLFLSNACELCKLCLRNVTRWNKGKNQGRKERNRPKFAHKTAPKPISNVPEAVCHLRYPRYHRNGEIPRACSGATDATSEVEDQNFSGARVSGSVLPSFSLVSFRFIGMRDPWFEC